VRPRYRSALAPVAALGQEQESGGTSGQAGGGGGLGKMTRRVRRKSEFVRLANERNFPHLVELALPPEGFRDVLLQIDTFHGERRIPVRRGRSRYEVMPFHIRFCFPDAATADAFRNRFGGECLTHAATSSDAPAADRPQSAKATGPSHSIWAAMTMGLFVPDVAFP
jgi:hypothetical protein